MRKDPLVELARRAIEIYVRERRVIEPPSKLPPELSRRAGVFVSIKKDGMLRGCIGTYLPTKENLAAEIIANAVKAATEDPRFPPVRPEELPRLKVSVDVLSPPEPCTEADLDPKRWCHRGKGLEVGLAPSGPRGRGHGRGAAPHRQDEGGDSSGRAV